MTNTLITTATTTTTTTTDHYHYYNYYSFMWLMNKYQGLLLHCHFEVVFETAGVVLHYGKVMGDLFLLSFAIASRSKFVPQNSGIVYIVIWPKADPVSNASLK